MNSNSADHVGDGAPSRPRATSARTRQRIAEAARVLFNEHGTAAISTNHIAAEAGLSPGNLYYHFADKKDVVRALHADYAAAHEGRWVATPNAMENVTTLRENLAVGPKLAWEYRFFEREILALLHADPELRAAYRATYERRLVEWLAFGERLTEQGVLRSPEPPRSTRDLATAIWLVAEGWLPFLDVTGDPQDPGQVAKLIDLVMVVIEPFLTPIGRRMLVRDGARGASGDVAVTGLALDDIDLPGKELNSRGFPTTR